MKLRQTTMEELKAKQISSKKKNVSDLLDEFMARGYQVAEVVLDDGEYSCYQSARASFCNSAKRFDGKIKLVSKNGRIYILRNDDIK